MRTAAEVLFDSKFLQISIPCNSQITVIDPRTENQVIDVVVLLFLVTML